jgi:nucleoside-diphosphate-sugar epimerase
MSALLLLQPVCTAMVPAQPPLLIVGAGVLGRLASTEWRAARADEAGEVVGVTRSDNAERSEMLRAEGITPRLREEVNTCGEKWPYVLFCASPSGNDDYPAEVAAALRLWHSSAPGGSGFVFTSSAGVYTEDQGGVVTEDSPVAEGTARTAKLLDAERAVARAGGTVVRLAGLYLEERGAHNFWLSQTEVQQRGDGLINQVHYQDAATAAVAALLRGAAGATYLAADDRPMTREQICRAACRAPSFRGRTAPRFAGASGPAGKACVGKVIDCSRTRAALGWAPRHRTFDAFITSLCAE